MTKRLISLVLVLIMLLSLCMTACSNEEATEGEAAEEEIQRPNLYLTLYAIVENDEGLEAVEEKISNYCKAKYKTQIDLRFYTEAEYEKALNEMYDKFAAQEAEKLKEEQAIAASKKEEAIYKASLGKEERLKYEQKKRQEAKKAEEEAKKEAALQAELIDRGDDKAVVQDVQMDIIYIPGMEQYYSWADQGLLADITTLVNNTHKKIYDFVYPSYMTAATLGSTIYGIPNNQAVTTNETYFVVNAALAEKYGVDWSQVRSITDLNDTFAAIKAGEPGVTPIYGDFDPENFVFYEDVDMAGVVGVFHDTLLNGKFTSTLANVPLNPNSSTSTAMVDHYATKALYRRNGYMSDTNQNFFLSVQELNEEEKAAWEAKGYKTVLYKGAPFTTEAALDVGLFGVSKYCQEPERAMEIIELLATDSTVRNLLAFGIEEVNYLRKSDNSNIITIIDDSYSMDFYKSGNTMIGYVPDTMDPDYIEKAMQKNLASSIDPFLGFRFNWEDEANQKWLSVFEDWNTYLEPIWQQLNYGTDNYLALMTEAWDQINLNENELLEMSYSHWNSSCGLRSQYASYTSKLIALSDSLQLENS